MAYPLEKASLDTRETLLTSATQTHSADEPINLEEHAGPVHLFVEWLMASLFPLVLGTVLYTAGWHLQANGWLWLIAVAIPLGFVLGDFVSGIVHWGADSYFHYNTPIIGAAFIKPFRVHHLFPKDICAHNLVSVVGNTCILAVPLMFVCLYALWRDAVPTWLAAGIFLTGMMSGATVLTNLFHKWAHLAEKAPSFVKWMQNKHLILPVDHHQVHHTAPHKRYYCITNGWVNPLLDRIQFFPHLENGLRRVGINTTIDNP